MSSRKLYLVAYDVSSPTRLRAALQLVKAHATGGQKSMYECFLTEAEKGDLFADLALVLNEETDRFALIRMDRNATVHTLGKAVPPSDPELYYFG